jgi:uncharacterized YigZ family protein
MDGTRHGNAEGYPVPAARHRVEQTIDRSRFIATLGHAADAGAARALLDEVRAEFPDATHHCWAYVAGPPGGTAAIGMSDGGEPHGTAGRPMLDVLLHSAIGEVAAVVTRYYGGTKLGTGGLVRAYGGAVQHALASLPRLQKVERQRVDITLDYGDVDTLRHLLAEHHAEILDETYAADVHYTAAVPVTGLAAFEAALLERTAGRCRVERAVRPVGDPADDA